MKLTLSSLYSVLEEEFITWEATVFIGVYSARLVFLEQPPEDDNSTTAAAAVRRALKSRNSNNSSSNLAVGLLNILA